MIVATVLEFPAMTRELYECVAASLPPGTPEGVVYHACASTPDGWRIMDFWESRKAFDRFTDGVYLPTARLCGVAEPTRREVLDTYHAGPVAR